MSDKSPLFTSALELFAHAVELYAGKRQRDLKFAILHLANAVELILKDALLDLGESIYRNPKETLNIWQAFEALNKHGIKVPGQQHIELLIDDRNAIQHRFGFPDERTTGYYLEEVRKFMREFLNEPYGLKFEHIIGDYLDSKYLPLIGLAGSPQDRVRALFDLSPATAIMEAFKDLEQRLMALSEAREEELPYYLARVHLTKIINELIKANYLPQDAAKKFETFTSARNAAAHGRGDFNWQQTLNLYHDFLKGVERAAKENFVYHWPAPDIATAVEVGAAFAAAWLDGATAEDTRALLSKAPLLPKSFDARLLQYACKILNVQQLDEEVRKALRESFLKRVREGALAS